MRAHGVPNFPDPDSQGSFPPLTQQALGVSKQTSLAAQQACEHLLSSGGSTATPQQRAAEVRFGSEGRPLPARARVPELPRPDRLEPGHCRRGIDPNSPQFQAAETSCEKQARKALGLP